MKTDVLIVGGGIIGVSTAYYLAKRGVQVTLLEKGDLAAGSSWGNAGLVCPCHSKPVPGPGVLRQGLKWMLNPESPFYIKPRLDPELIAWLWRFRSFCNMGAVEAAIPRLRDLQRASQALYEAWIAAEEISCYFEKVGGLELFLTQQAFAHAGQEVDLMRRFGLDLSLLDASEVQALEPAAHPGVVGGIQYHEDAHLDPGLFIEALAARAGQAGARILTQTEMTGFVRQGETVAAVRTSAGDFRAEQVILAAGVWTARMAADLGLAIPMQPGKGYSITMDRPPVSPKIPLHLAEARGAVTPMGSYLRFAGTMELAGMDFSLNQRRINAIIRNASRYLRDFGDPKIVRLWSGMRPLAPDGLPYLGRVPGAANTILATGHSMLGISLGPITGQLVGELAMGDPPSQDMAALRVDRFS